MIYIVSSRVTLPHLALFRCYVVKVKVLVFRLTLQWIQYNVICNTCFCQIVVMYLYFGY